MINIDMEYMYRLQVISAVARHRHMALLSLLLFFFSILGINRAEAETMEPSALIVTWQQDPTTTVTIDWHTRPADQADPKILYKTEEDTDWQEALAAQMPFPHSDRTIHRVELTGLEPGSTYSFKVGEFQRTYSFETMPAELDRPLRFATGGNIMYDPDWMAEMNLQVMSHEPDFIVWGGDLAYAMGLEDKVQQWYDFFGVMMETLISEEGKVMPVIVAIGDHETQKQYIFNYDDVEPTDEWRAGIAPYFFSLWAFPGQPGYNVLDFGDYMSLFILDSMHANDAGGEQETWLRDNLSDRQHVPHLFPFYHVGGWASVKGVENGPEQMAVYDHFYPAFEDYGVRVAFENHDYAYKRTPPMQGGNAVSSGNGVVYMGDGAWGVPTFDHVRFLNPSRMRPKSERYGHIEIRADGIMDNISDIWYLDAFQSTRHFTLATVFREKQHFIVIDKDGNTIDEYTEDDYDPYYVREPEPHTGRWITNLLVYEGTDWEVDASLESGKNTYVDSDATLQSVPDEYRGMEWIQTAVDAADRNQILASLEAPGDGWIYVAVDDRLPDLPSWLNDWEPTGDHLAIDENGQVRTMNIFRQSVQRDDFVELGPQNNKDASMYIVFADYVTYFFSDLTVNDGTHWRKAPSFDDERPVFVDETFTTSSIPELYRGMEWIQAANISRNSPDSPLATFRMNYDGDVYLAMNTQFASSPPQWMDNWQATGDVIRAGHSFNVFKQSFQANQTVELEPLVTNRGTIYIVLVDSDQVITQAEPDEKPSEYHLYGNYPNPFNASTVFRFELPEDGFTTLRVFDPIGRQVATVVNESLSAGTHSYTFDASRLSSGLYLFQLESGSFRQAKPMMLIK